jgi:hypothetical protein
VPCAVPTKLGVMRAVSSSLLGLHALSVGSSLTVCVQGATACALWPDLTFKAGCSCVYDFWGSAVRCLAASVSIKELLWVTATPCVARAWRPAPVFVGIVKLHHPLFGALGWL